jgi:hypothetical protein
LFADVHRRERVPLRLEEEVRRAGDDEGACFAARGGVDLLVESHEFLQMAESWSWK